LDYVASANPGLAGNSATSTTARADAATNNMTDALIQNYAQNILQMNNNFAGMSTTSAHSVKLPSVDTTGQFVSQAINQSIEYKTYTIQDIAVSNDVSTSSQLQYLASIGTITQKDFGSFRTTIDQMVSNAINDNDATALNQYISIAQKEVLDLLALKPPSNWAAWHLSNINLWEEKIAVFSAIADFTNDPVKAIAGLNQVSDVLSKNDALNATLKDKYNALIL
jgi:hypothetical protein